MIKRFEKVLKDDLDFFQEPFKKWTIRSAIVDSLLTYLPEYSTKNIQNLIQ